MNKVSPTKGENSARNVELVGVIPSTTNNSNNTNTGTDQITLADWDVDLFDCSSDRCYTWCCAYCALANARTYVDGSDFCFNACCLNPCVTFWLIHSAYGIPCNCERAVECCCFTNCYLNRVYQTAKNRGNPNKTKRGREHNVAKLNHPACPTCVCSSCCAAFACPCCYSWYKLNQHLNMPWYLAVGVCPWTAQNLLRYQYGVEGSDCFDECFLGCMAWMFMGPSLLFMPIIASTKGLLVVQSCETQLAKDQGQVGVVGGGQPPKRYLATKPHSDFDPLGRDWGAN